jgi:YfiH family protein
MKANMFVLRKANGVSYYSCRAFEELPGLHHGFSTRHGGIPGAPACSLNLGNSTWDSAERVNGNRHRFLSAVHLQEAHLVTLHQVHSDRVHIIKEIFGQGNKSEGDALITKVEGIALSVQIADCLPVLIADPVKKVVAAVHSGWRGTLKGIALKTVQEMQNAFGSNPEHLLVAVGPGIRACCFEVGQEVADAFNHEYPGCALTKPMKARPGKFLLDLPNALEIQFQTAGIPPNNRHDLAACTRCNPNEFFSYRAEGPSSGRMMAVIGRTQLHLLAKR